MKSLIRISVMILLISISVACEKNPIVQSVGTPYVRTYIMSITQTTATFGGLVLSDGGDPIFSEGICWSTHQDPTIEQDSLIEIGPNSSFTGFISSLNPNTLYYFRTFAKNSAGTGYGNTVTSTTLLSEIKFNPNLIYGVVTDIENNKYKTITIGTQTWMAENLRATKYQNGDLIGTTSSPLVDITKEHNPKYEWAYDGNESISVLYGRLYTWDAVSDNRNVCPVGWHVPTHDEWTTLTVYLVNNGFGFGGSGNKIAKSMVATTGWEIDETTEGSIGNNLSGNNSSGFSAIPTGFRGIGTEGFSYIGDGAYWWSSTEQSTDLAWRGCYMFFNSGSVYDGASDKQGGLSVRCIQNH